MKLISELVGPFGGILSYKKKINKPQLDNVPNLIKAAHIEWFLGLRELIYVWSHYLMILLSPLATHKWKSVVAGTEKRDQLLLENFDHVSLKD